MIPVVWWGEKERGSWSSVNMLNEMFDSYPCEHSVPIHNELPKADGGIIVFHGGNILLRPDAAVRMSQAAKIWKSVIFISAGDENTDFPGQLLQHENMIYWCQTPKPGKVKADRYFIEGYPNDCPTLLHAAGNVPRTYDWFFAGQITHARRSSMVEALKKYSFGAHALVTTTSFGAGLPHDYYYSMMKQACVVPCPSGPATPDTFRFAEALEAGAIPVIDACAVDGVMGYWDMVIGKDHPFTVIEDWATFPSVMETIMGGKTLKELQRITQLWWRNYRDSFGTWLAKDIAKLGGF